MGALKSYTACAEDAGSRIDAVLAAHGLYPSRSAAARAVEDGAVYVNGSTVAKKHTLCAGDTVVYEVPDAREQGPVQGQAIPLDIRYEDDDMLVISKQAGLVCHPSVDHADGTLVNALVYHCGVEHLCNVQGESDRPGIVHRLDRDTTGLMLAAKNDAAGLALMADIRDRAVDRRYLALGARRHPARYRHDRCAHRPFPQRAHAHGGSRVPLGARRPHHVPRARALRAWPARQRLHPDRLQAVHGQDPSDPRSHAVREASAGGRSGVQLRRAQGRRCQLRAWVGSSCIPSRWGSPSP